ncbi:MAG TPA: AmmeMemoRadiSam system radical SAM enzyme [Synergistales bacterium]|nr:AmmeMemoRadiSam system radical SAM enzyme [Synergistales bacterium]
MDRTALYWIARGDDINCHLCPRECIISQGLTGACGVRENSGGRLVSLNYGWACVAVDPVEKKPLYHWRPGTRILSLGTFGCNLFCPYCQNYHLSRSKNHKGLSWTNPSDVLRLLQHHDAPSVAFTYNEPTVWYEFVRDTSLLLKREKKGVVLVTNGYISRKPLEDLIHLVDAMNIDLKGFSDSTYSMLGGTLAPVLDTVRIAFERSVHVEITHLVVPGINDSIEEFRHLVRWIAGISESIPLHISRYFPDYRWALPPTPIPSIRVREEIASEFLENVYSGNLQSRNNTLCPVCGEVLVERDDLYRASVHLLEDGTCPRCRTPRGIVMS